MKTVTLGNSIVEIGDHAFESCGGFGKLILPSSLKSIGAHAFHSCKNLTEVTVPDKVRTIGDYAFAVNSQLESVTLGESVFSIGRLAFYQTHLKELYYNCKECYRIDSGLYAIEKIVIGENVESIPEHAFSVYEDNCEIYSLATEPPSAHDNSFNDYTYQNDTLYVPEGSAKKYKDAWNCWYLFENISDTAAVGNIIAPEVTAEGCIRIFNMEGRYVGSSVEGLAPGLYIIHQGKAVSKYLAI